MSAMMVHHLQTPFNKERRIISKKRKGSQKGYREQRGHWRNWEFQVQWFFPLLLLLLSRFNRVWLSVTPWTAAHQAPIPEILQARVLVWVAIAFSNAWKWKMKVKPLSHVPLLAIPWTAAHQAPPSMGFSRQEYWSRVPLPLRIFHGLSWNSLSLAALLPGMKRESFFFMLGPALLLVCGSFPFWSPKFILIEVSIYSFFTGTVLFSILMQHSTEAARGHLLDLKCIMY